MRYYHKLNHRQRKNFLRRVRLFFVFALVAAGLLIGGIFIDNTLRNDVNTEESTTSGVTTSYFAPTAKIFRTASFQFQTDSTWAESAKESTSNKFVYRSMRGSLIEHELIIYVNNIPELSATRVLPVNLKGGNELLPITVSDHCSKAFKDPFSRPRATTLERVTFSCFSDSSQYTVLIGLVGGDTRIKLQRPDGSSAVYSIYYSNVTATPNSSMLETIANTFQTR